MRLCLIHFLVKHWAVLSLYRLLRDPLRGVKEFIIIQNYKIIINLILLKFFIFLILKNGNSLFYALSISNWNIYNYMFCFLEVDSYEIFFYFFTIIIFNSKLIDNIMFSFGFFIQYFLKFISYWGYVECRSEFVI